MLIGAVDLLPKLVSGVLIPPAVAAELADHRTPATDAMKRLEAAAET